MTKHLGRIAVLTGVWVLMWGDLTLANVISGILVSGVMLVVFPVERRRSRLGRALVFRPLAVLRFAGYVAMQLVISNAEVSWQILSRRRNTRTGVVACPLEDSSDGMITLLANVLALSPGMMPVEVSTSPPIIFVHVLRLHDPEQTREKVAHLDHLAHQAFGAPREQRRRRRSVTP